MQNYHLKGYTPNDLTQLEEKLAQERHNHFHPGHSPSSPGGDDAILADAKNAKDKGILLRWKEQASNSELKKFVLAVLEKVGLCS